MLYRRTRELFAEQLGMRVISRCQQNKGNSRYRTLYKGIFRFVTDFVREFPVLLRQCLVSVI